MTLYKTSYQLTDEFSQPFWSFVNTSTSSSYQIQFSNTEFTFYNVSRQNSYGEITIPYDISLSGTLIGRDTNNLTKGSWGVNERIGISVNGNTVYQIPTSGNSVSVTHNFSDINLTQGDVLRVFVDNTNAASGSFVRLTFIPTFVREPLTLSNICFPGDTLIETNTGKHSLSMLHKMINNHTNHNITIDGKPVRFVTKTKSYERELVCFEKNALMKGIPNQKTIMTRNHSVLYNGIMIKAGNLLSLSNPKIHTVPYNGQSLYNIVMDTHDRINVNNLICETLDPNSDVFKFLQVLHSVSNQPEVRNSLIKTYNSVIEEVI